MHSMPNSRRVYGRRPLTLLGLPFVAVLFAFIVFVLAYIPAKGILSSPNFSDAIRLIPALIALILSAWFFKGFVLFVEVGEKEIVVGFPHRRERIRGIREVRVEIPMVRKGLVHMGVRIVHSGGSTILNFLNDFKDGKAMVRDIEKSSGIKAETFFVESDGSSRKLAKSWSDA